MTLLAVGVWCVSVMSGCVHAAVELPTNIDVVRECRPGRYLYRYEGMSSSTTCMKFPEACVQRQTCACLREQFTSDFTCSDAPVEVLERGHVLH